jgi:hypothetical protein
VFFVAVLEPQQYGFAQSRSQQLVDHFLSSGIAPGIQLMTVATGTGIGD